MNVSLTPQLEALIRQKVASGRYKNPSEVIREALQLLEEKERLELLRNAIAIGDAELERGEGILWTMDTMRQLRSEAEEEDRQGLPISDDVQP